jgi:endonuclease/exonuclease/phosphatase family metal-dependent hydrolase
MRVLFSALFGIVYDAVFSAELPMAVVGGVFVALLAALAAPAALDLGRAKPGGPDADPGRVFFVTASLAGIVRVSLTVNDPQVRLAGSILLVAVCNLYLAHQWRSRPGAFATIWVLGLAADQVWRVLGYTWDITLQPRFLLFQIAIGLGLIAVARRNHTEAAFEDDPGYMPALSIGGGLALAAWLFLQTSGLAQANVIARWTGANYDLVAPLLFLVTITPLFTVRSNDPGLLSGRLLALVSSWGILVRGALLMGVILLGLVAGRLVAGLVGLAALLLVQLVLVGSLPLILAPAANRCNGRSGTGVAVAMLVFLMFQLAFAFAFTYPYTVPEFRNAGLPIFVVAGAIYGLRVGLRAPERRRSQPIPANNTLVVGLSVVFLLVLLWSDAGEVALIEPGETIHVATYNIHYGYDSDWRHTLEQQAQTIQAGNVDIVLLQEVDAGRMTSYGVDNAYWLGRRLRMTAVFGPAIEGLSGVAILTRLPVMEAAWALLPSRLEQTALVRVTIAWDEDHLEAHGVWLGLEERERLTQLEAALAAIGDAEVAVLGGDLNSLPDSALYERMASAGFVEPFVDSGREGYTDPAVAPAKRIDYVWARGLVPIDGWVSASTASDHRMVVVRLSKPD